MGIDPRERRSWWPTPSQHRGDHFDRLETLECSRPRSGAADNEVALESLSQWQLARRRFQRHRLALVGVFIFVFMVLIAVFGPILVPYKPLDLPGRHQARR